MSDLYVPERLKAAPLHVELKSQRQHRRPPPQRAARLLAPRPELRASLVSPEEVRRQRHDDMLRFVTSALSSVENTRLELERIRFRLLAEKSPIQQRQ